MHAPIWNKYIIYSYNWIQYDPSVDDILIYERIIKIKKRSKPVFQKISINTISYYSVCECIFEKSYLRQRRIIVSTSFSDFVYQLQYYYTTAQYIATYNNMPRCRYNNIK